MEQKKKTPAVRFRGFHEEWESNFLERLTTKIGDGLHGTPKYVDDTQNYFINGNNLVDGIVKINQDTKVVSDKELNANDKNLTENSILISLNGTIGNISFCTEKNLMLSKSIGYLNFVEKSKFIFHYLKSPICQSFFKSELTGSTIKNLSLKTLRETSINLPKSKPEQTKIGSFFENLDHLLSKHQTQHQKLKALKKAMLGKLFPKQGVTVPEIRFKGFTGDWEVKTLGEVGSTFTGLSGKTKEDFGHGKGRFVTYMNVFTNAISDKNLIEPIEIDNSQNEVLKGDVFFTTSSETAEEVGMSSVWMEEKSNIYLNSFCFGYRPKIELDNYYLANMLRSNVFRKKITFLAQGISRYNISKNKVMNLEIQVPSLKEQQRIGNYFKNLDQLITKHATQIEKLSAIKKACLSKMFV